jgi:hypothetical protein
MTDDEYDLAASLLRGYERRKTAYFERINRLAGGGGARLTVDYTKPAVQGGRPPLSCEEAAEELKKLNGSFNFRAVCAVDRAKSELIWKYGDERAEQLFKALEIHTRDRFRYTFTVLSKQMELFISKRTFYRLKAEFLGAILNFFESF